MGRNEHRSVAAGESLLCPDSDSIMWRAAAIAYAREGADVAINYFQTEGPDVQEVAEFIKQGSRKAVLIPNDPRGEAFSQKLVSRALSELAGLDVMVLNTDVQHQMKSILDMVTDLFDRTMNFYAPL